MDVYVDAVVNNSIDRRWFAALLTVESEVPSLAAGLQRRIRVTPMYTTRKKVPDFSLVKSHT